MEVSLHVKRVFFPVFLAILLLYIASGCGYEPDTSAPERPEIERSADWRGALLYIADRDGPTPGFGSIRVYDNVSGFVEMTIEQTRAAAPSDMFVTPDGSSMYVASAANGLIVKFRWDGSSWNPSGDIEAPASSLLALRAAPDGFLYAVDGSPQTPVGRLFKIDTATDRIDQQPIDIPGLAGITGISWTPDGKEALVAGKSSTTGSPVMLTVSWPQIRTLEAMDLPVNQIHQLVASGDGRFVFAAAGGVVLKIETGTGAVAASLRPAAVPETEYFDADLSADGRFLFVTGAPPASDSSLYIVDLSTGEMVNTVNHISRRADGIQRTE